MLIKDQIFSHYKTYQVKGFDQISKKSSFKEV